MFILQHYISNNWLNNRKLIETEERLSYALKLLAKRRATMENLENKVKNTITKLEELESQLKGFN